MKERLSKRTTFNEVAALYGQVRPGYPEVLFDDLIEFTGILSEGKILEIECGTGQATRPLARRGFGITCVELGESLAEVARRNFAAYPNVFRFRIGHGLVTT